MPSPSPTLTFEEPVNVVGVGSVVTATPTITVASYNMRKAIGTDRPRRPDRVLHVLQEIDADVVALQEADKRIGGRGAAVPVETDRLAHIVTGDGDGWVAHTPANRLASARFLKRRGWRRRGH